MAENKEKKTYYYTTKIKNSNRKGYDVEADVFFVRSGKIVLIGTAKWNSLTGKSEKAEVYDYLLKRGSIPVKLREKKYLGPYGNKIFISKL
ncbi:hypothetical protein LJC53_02915 [Bacteroidales bacterium OttesenSCG-928-C03]|nr:hypothetical protein [Bacteroidales bacterium OttesenSCG-928-C03]MDL2326143.1 hypothetical protein [Bacteroidales bacterium OttesenSCG-928-A14]